MMGRHINEAFVSALGELVNLDLHIEPCAGQSCSGLSEAPEIHKTSDIVTTASAIMAIDGTPAVVLTIAGLRRLIVKPLERLGSTVSEVARTNDPSLRAPVGRTDEIGELAGGVNIMLARLENSQRQLIEAKEKVEGASEAKSRFLSRVSHELRTPINGVLAYAQLLQLDHADGESRESIDQIITSARHITTLVDEFLDIARIEAGAIPIDIERIHPAAIASEVIAMTRPLAQAQSTTVELIGEHDPVALADPVRLRQTMLNLVSNAIKYGRSDEPITITVSSQGDRTAIEVRDRGTGINGHHLERLFTPFDRLDADSSDQEGSGIGLSVAKQLTELMDGTIDVTSEVGAGTAFTVSLAAPRPSPSTNPTSDARSHEMASGS
jgi:ribose transport system substrate-binding protein